LTKEQSLTEGEKKSLALQKIMSEQDELKLLLKKKQDEELQITSGAQRRHSSQSEKSINSSSFFLRHIFTMLNQCGSSSFFFSAPQPRGSTPPMAILKVLGQRPTPNNS